MSIYLVNNIDIARLYETLRVSEITEICFIICDHITSYLIASIPRSCRRKRGIVRKVHSEINALFDMILHCARRSCVIRRKINLRNFTIESKITEFEPNHTFLVMHEWWKPGTICSHLLINVFHDLIEICFSHMSCQSSNSFERAISGKILSKIKPLTQRLKNAIFINPAERFCTPNTDSLYFKISVGEIDEFYLKFVANENIE